MPANYQALADLLHKRLSVIADAELRTHQPEEQLRQLQAASEAITSWTFENKADCPAQLRHFLQQSSLSKALDFLTTEGLV